MDFENVCDMYRLEFSISHMHSSLLTRFAAVLKRSRAIFADLDMIFSLQFIQINFHLKKSSLDCIKFNIELTSNDTVVMVKRSLRKFILFMLVTTLSRNETFTLNCTHNPQHISR